MLKELGSEQIACGKIAEIFLFEPPGPDIPEKLMELMRHKGDDTLRGIQSRLYGAYAGCCVDRFFFAEIEGQIAGMLWYGYGKTSYPIANFGHVYTSPQFRRQGVAKILLEYFNSDFLASPAKAAFCYSSKPHIVKNYTPLGFQPCMTGTTVGSLMLSNPPVSRSFAEIQKEYYGAVKEIHVVPASMRWRHDLDCLGKYTDRLFDERCFLAATLPDFTRAYYLSEDDKDGVLLNFVGNDRCVGWAGALRMLNDADGARTFDYVIHSDFTGEIHHLIEEAVIQCRKAGPLFAFVRSSRTDKLNILCSCGFQTITVIPEYFPNDGITVLSC
jgi:GNAT superfamily N-acetyltransferase